MMEESFDLNMDRLMLFVADSNGCYPVPASKGGAVSTLVEMLVAGNEEKRLIDMTVVSYYDEKAYELSNKYHNVKFIWIKVPKFIKILDKGLFWSVSTFTHIKATSFKSLFSLLYYSIKSSFIIRKSRCATVVLEHNIPMVWMIRWSGYSGKYFHHLHNIPRTNAMCRRGLDKCSGFLCISQYMVNEIMSKNNPIGPIEKSRVKFLFNCIDTTVFKLIPNELLSVRKEDFGISDNSKIIIFAGRITWEKGVDKILEALDYINSNVELLIVGAFMLDESKDPYFLKIKQLSEKHKERIHYTGYIAHDKLPDLYNLADIAVLPSMWEEPAGLTMLESMACGTPVITTCSGGIPEYVGDAAIVLRRDDCLPHEIARNVDLLLSDKELYDTYSKRGVKRINKMFSSDDYINKFYNIVCD